MLKAETLTPTPPQKNKKTNKINNKTKNNKEETQNEQKEYLLQASVEELAPSFVQVLQADIYF